jgi:hypothetical protein
VQIGAGCLSLIPHVSFENYERILIKYGIEVYIKSCRDKFILVGFEVLTAVSTKMVVFWVVAPCSLVEIYQRFRCPCCLHHQGDE